MKDFTELRPRILHLLNTSSFSGAENVAISIIEGLNNNFEFAYASLEGPIRKHLSDRNIDFISLKYLRPSDVRQIIMQFKPDIIHAHDYRASLISAFCFSKIPIISHIHNNVNWAKTVHPYSILYLFTTLRFKKVLNVSYAVQDEYIFNKLIANKSLVFTNPLNPCSIRKRACEKTKFDNTYDIVFLGRLAGPKNPVRFIKIIGDVIKFSSNVRVAIVGDGHLKEECIAIIDKLQLSDNISMLGFVDNPYPIVKNSRVLCMTSSWEGFGLAAAEALALGVPVVATPTGGLSGIVDNDCGLLTNDDVEYVQEVVRLLDDDNYWTQKSKRAIQKAEMINNYDYYMSNMKDLYIDIVKKNQC